LGKLFTPLCPCTKQYNTVGPYRLKGGDALRLGR